MLHNNRGRKHGKKFIVHLGLYKSISGNKLTLSKQSENIINISSIYIHKIGKVWVVHESFKMDKALTAQAFLPCLLRNVEFS